MAKKKEEVKDLKKGKEVEATYVEKKSTKKKISSVERKKSTEKKEVKKESVKPKKKVEEKQVEEVTKEIIEEKVQTEEVSLSQKSYAFPRFVAYLIDVILVTMVSSLVLTVVPENKNYEAYLEEYETIQTQFLDGSIDSKVFENRAKDLVYDLDYSNVVPMIIEITILILYYVVFQFYNKGQTIGKKLLKIRVVSENSEEVSMNQYILRSFIIPSIAGKLLIVALVLFIGRNYYTYASFIVQGIETVLVIVSIFLVLYSQRGRGLHDHLAKTKVIMVEES